MKHKIQKTYRTKHFNVVSNPQHGVCLLFDRKGLGLYQSRSHRDYWLVMKDSFIDALNKVFLSFRTHVRNLVPHIQGRKRNAQGILRLPGYYL